MTKKFCHYVMYLDRIPRYGRLYFSVWMPGKPSVRWAWQKRGRWGMNILDRLGLLDRYIDETNPHLKDG